MYYLNNLINKDYYITIGYISIFLYYYLINKYKIQKKNKNKLLIICFLFINYLIYKKQLFKYEIIQIILKNSFISLFIANYYYIICNKII